MNLHARKRQRNRNVWLKTGTILAAVCLSLTACGRAKPQTAVNQPSKTKPSATTQKPKVLRSPTTGLPEKRESGQFFGVIVENYPDARPQTGLENADIVYEMEAEGTITRYIAFFHDDIPPEIGPDRSARPYFVQTAEDWAAPFIHFGGSPDAYRMLKQDPYPQIDGIYDGQYFVRDPSRVAPHNAYLITNRLPKYHEHVVNHHWRFGKPDLKGTVPAHTLALDFNSFTQVTYLYQPSSRRYLRDLQGKPDDDRQTGKQVYADNIIVQYTKMSAITNDPKERITINLNGPGKALYFMDGRESQGTWARNASGGVQYFDKHGHLITLRPGKTWIEVVD
ncbi:MAG: DUF3048 domain-containing protein, partial [Alicyclobacillus sp.]|nr:DUF3048 domain-containing protein [Alicyclobacillus sp.]